MTEVTFGQVDSVRLIRHVALVEMVLLFRFVVIADMIDLADGEIKLFYYIFIILYYLLYYLLYYIIYYIFLLYLKIYLLLDQRKSLFFTLEALFRGNTI